MKAKAGATGSVRMAQQVSVPSRVGSHSPAKNTTSSRSGLQGDVARLLAGSGLAPFVPAVRWNQAAPVGERRPEVRAGRCFLGADIDGRGGIVFRPGRTEAPVREIEGGRVIWRHVDRGNLNTWRDVVLGVHVADRQLEVEVPGCYAAARSVESKTATHGMPPPQGLRWEGYRKASNQTPRKGIAL